MKKAKRIQNAKHLAIRSNLVDINAKANALLIACSSLVKSKSRLNYNAAINSRLIARRISKDT